MKARAVSFVEIVRDVGVFIYIFSVFLVIGLVFLNYKLSFIPDLTIVAPYFRTTGIWGIAGVLTYVFLHSCLVAELRLLPGF